MEFPGDRICRGCEATSDTRFLERCTICHKDFCDDCGIRGHGKRFCTQGCADVFFFGSEDPDDPRYEDENADWDE